MKNSTIFKENILTKNPIFVLLLGMCPSLAITTSIDNALGMMLAVTLVLIFSNLIVSLLRKIIPTEIRLPIFIIIIATFVTCVTMLAEAYAYDLYESLGVFLPLITVNCIVLGRAEAFASKNGPVKSVLDGLATGIGFGLALICISFFRELIGTGNIVLHGIFSGKEIFNLMELLKLESFGEQMKISLFASGAGAFLVLALLIAFFKFIGDKRNSKKVEVKEENVNA